MLVLARKPTESVVIGQDIEVVVLEVKGDIVRLGIKAPTSISVYRKEIYDQILKENLTASQADISLEQIRTAIQSG